MRYPEAIKGKWYLVQFYTFKVKALCVGPPRGALKYIPIKFKSDLFAPQTSTFVFPYEIIKEIKKPGVWPMISRCIRAIFYRQ